MAFSDIDECLNVTVTCGENAECLNTDGSYSCQCMSGFAGDGYSNCTGLFHLASLSRMKFFWWQI